MASLKQRIASRVSAIRQRRPLVDHAVRTQRHYGGVGGSQQAGAVTYFAFLSFFPIMALAFFVIGYVSQVYPDAKDTLREAIGQAGRPPRQHDIEQAQPDQPDRSGYVRRAQPYRTYPP